MASSQEPEVVLAQRLAANEKPIRTKAIKKLRKYINARSQNAAGGFTSEELLKLWKGLFYCLWMQDKPLLQEELSNRISTLIHSFHNSDGEFLYLESFLQTIKREWTGIDRLRMDKFFQLVRFMFRQTFEMLKRKNWESSEVSRFLELLMAQLLQSGSGAPSGLQLHVLDLYMTELAAVGSEELTADQNLIFIEPFCKTAAKTKDRALFGAICRSIFSAIIDQAPFAIEDLIKEMKVTEASDSDSGQASEEEDEEEKEEQVTKKTKSKAIVKKGKQMNGHKSNDDNEEDEDDDDDDLLHLEESDTEPSDEDIGPVLQFDYSGLADRLFEFASRSNTPSHNRQKLYKIIKRLRDLAEGIFPQDEYPEEVSTDEDDDMFGSRKRLKKVRRRMREKEEEDNEDEEGAPAAKKSKGKKKDASTSSKQNKDLEQDGKEPASLAANNENKKKKKKKRKKKKKAEPSAEEKSEQKQTVAESPVEDTEGGLQCLQASPTQDSISSVKVTEAATAEGQSDTLLLSEGAKQPSVTVTEESIQPDPCDPDHQDQCEKALKKTKKKKKQSLEVQDQPGLAGTEAESSETHQETALGKKTKKGLKVNEEAEVELVKSEEVAEESTTTTGKKTKKGLKAEKSLKSLQEVNSMSAEEPDCTIVEIEIPAESTAAAKKKGKKKHLKAEGAQEESPDAEIPSEDSSTEPLKKIKTKGKEQEQEEKAEVSPAADESAVTPLKKKKRKNNKEKSAEEEGAAVQEPHLEGEKEPCDVSMTSSVKKKKKKKALETAEVANGDTESNEAEVLSITETPAKKKKRKIPVTFEFEADELEAAASVNGHAEDEAAAGDAAEPSTPLSSKKKAKKSEFITFQNNVAVPTPLFCKTKGGLSTPLSSKKKSQTPKSESKKVTFGLKNNKTAEFRKTDRSLLVSPDGSSRVPFDPKQKPKCGVLKSPASSLPARVKKTPNKKKSCPATPQSTPKRRPSAADFF